MGENSRIVSYGADLYFNNTKIKGCSAMWDGIRMLSEYTKIEFINNSKIEDAKVAIGIKEVNHTPHKSVKLLNSSIVNCKFGIEMDQSCTVTIDSSKILGGTLLNGDSPYSGIRIFDAVSGASLLSINHSSIEGFSTEAIYLQNGSIETSILDTKFSSVLNGNGIYSTNSDGIYSIKNCSFEGLKAAITILKISKNTDIIDNNFNNITDIGIYLENINSNTTKIEHNNIKNCPGGITVANPKVSSIVSVSNNIISKSSNIGINYVGISPNGFGSILNNSIDSSETSILVKNIIGCNITNNVIKSFKNGITLSNSNNCTIKWNNINGVVQNNNEAISIDMSMGNSFSCNTTNNALRGFHSNNTCGNSFLYANQFREHNTGLRVESGSIIGKQVHHWNTWLDSTHYANKGAENLNSDPFIVDRSKFTVATPNNTAYHPTNSGNGMFFVDPIATPWVIKECLQVAPEDPERNSNLYSMTSAYSTNTPEEKTNGWESKRYVYGELKAHPEYMQQSNDLANFYTQQANTVIAAFYEVGKALAEERYTDAAQLNGAISTTEVYESNLKAVYQLLSQTTTWTVAQTQNLLSIAQQCPAQGGSAVFLARDLYTSKVDRSANFDNINCNGVNNRASKENSLESAITLVPNPASDVVRLLNLPTNLEVKIEIVNLQGNLLKTKTFDNSNSTLELSFQEYPSGIYFIRVSSNQQLLSTNKLVIIK